LTQPKVPSSSDAARTGTTPEAAESSVGGRADAARDGVISASVLGWHVAELFHTPLPRSMQRRQASSDKLVGMGELDPLSRARLLLAQVRADMERAWRYDDSGQRYLTLLPSSRCCRPRSASQASCKRRWQRCISSCC
jgi:hypothetical protein